MEVTCNVCWARRPKETNKSYLAMVQPETTTSDPATWRNTVTNENYGPTVRVIPLAFKAVWVERSKDPPHLTVDRFKPKSIDVYRESPNPGARGFPMMINPSTGNKVEELFVYACLLVNNLNAGIIYLSPTIRSMRTCKSWNALLRCQRLSSGKAAPIYAFSWDLTLDLVQNPMQPNNPNEKIAKFVRVDKAEIVSTDLFYTTVKPYLAGAKICTIAINPNTDVVNQKPPFQLTDNLKKLDLERDYDIEDYEKIINWCDSLFDRSVIDWFKALQIIYQKFTKFKEYNYEKGDCIHIDWIQWSTNPTYGKLPFKDDLKNLG